MTEFAKMDIFFFIASISTVVLVILMIVLMIFLIKISADIKYITKKAKTEADLLGQDLSDLRENVIKKGLKLKYLLSFFNNLSQRSKKK